MFQACRWLNNDLAKTPAGLETVWKPFLWLAIIGALLFWFSLARFRKALASMA